jgi:hypothetical protein
MRSSSGYALLEGFRHLFKRLANEPALFPTDVNNLLARFDLERCLNPAMWQLGPSRDYIEQLRAYLFRAEQLIDTQPLPARGFFILLPHDISALLETIKAAQHCLEEWFKSQTCKALT